MSNKSLTTNSLSQPTLLVYPASRRCTKPVTAKDQGTKLATPTNAPAPTPTNPSATIALPVERAG